MPKRRTLASVATLSLPLGNFGTAAVKEAKLRGGDDAASSRSTRASDRTLACVSNEWHVDFTKMTGHWCSNSLAYPDSMKSEPNMLHPSARACCDHFYPNDNCQVNKVCETEQVAADPSSQAASRPKPTGRPTPKPSPKPTKPLVQYYSVPNSGLCEPVNEKTPSWIDEFYTDWTKCCKVGWVFEKCMEEAPPGAIASPLTKTTTTSTTASVPLVYYYSSPNSGLCAPVDKNTPSWVEEYYTDWTECCKVGWVFEKCMKEAPPGAVISVTDNIMPTTTPKILYYAIPTSGMCEEVGESTPSWMVESDFTESFSDCCKNKSWNTDPCLAQGVSTELLTPEPTIQETPEPSSRPSTFVPGPTSIPSRHPATNQPISSEPTRSPMLIDSYQTSCDAALWHPSADYSMCSNSFGYDTSWDDPSLSSTYLHTKLSDCCAAFFDAWGKECIVHDICSTSPPTKSPQKRTDSPTAPPTTSIPTKSPSFSPTTLSPTTHPTTTQPSKSPTNLPTTTPIKYYVVFSTGICTPLDAFTPYWMTESDFFLDYSKCCESSWNSDACLATSPSAQPTTHNPSTSPSSRPSLRPTSKHPTYNPTTSRPVSKTSAYSNDMVSSENALTCKSYSWHPSEDYSKCTNSLDFPESWSLDPYKEIFLHESKEGCCEVFFDSWGRNCETEDTCNISTTCVSAPWHPADDYSKCTNGFGYNDAWNHPPLKNSYLYESLDDCCDTFFVAWGKECVVEDICLPV